MSCLASSVVSRVASLTVTRSAVRSFASGANAAASSSAASPVGSNPRFPPPPSNTNTPPSVFDFRRLANRSKWGPPREEDPEITILDVFPKLGDDAELNWTINRYQITPREEGYRNLHARGLRMFVKGTLDANKSLHVSFEAPKAHETFVLGVKAEEGKPAPAGVKSATSDQLKVLFREVRRHLSEGDQVFVHDGLVGNQKARIFTEDASVALILNQLLPAVTLGDVTEYTHELTAYIVPSLPSSVRASLKLGSFTLIDVERNNVFVVGTPSSSTIRDALSEAVNYQTRSSGVVLSGDAIVSGNRSVLILSKDNSFLSSALGSELSQSLFASNKVAWTKDGLVRLFNGVSYPSNSFQNGDLVENKGQVNRALSYSSHALVAPHPSVVVFFGQDIPNISEGVSKLSSKQALTNAASLLQSSPFGDNGQSSRFEELLKESKAEVILFNKKSGASSSDVAAKIKSLLQ